MSEIEGSVVAAFRDLLGDITDDVLEAYEKETDAAVIADMVSLDSLDDLAEDLKDPLEAIYYDTSEDAFKSLDITEDSLFDIIHVDAQEYASARAAELVGKRWVAGKLVDNPDAQWAIDEATRDGLRSVIEQSYADGLSPSKLAKAIKESFSFSKERAALIAKTETSKASIQGTLAGWKRSGMVEGKSSLLSDDHDGDDECDEAEADGVIPLDEDFSTGDDGPPYHPGCNCTLVAELIEDEGDEI